MITHPWSSPATVFRYSPLDAGGSEDPAVLFSGSLEECIKEVGRLDAFHRLNIEIEADDGSVLLNGTDVEKIIRSSEFRFS